MPSLSIKTWQLLTGIAVISTITVLQQIPQDTWFSSASASLLAGVISLAYMATACILASRWAAIENLLGGLDRMYDMHKWLGIWALIFAAYHFIFKAKLNTWELLPILELSKYWTRMVRQLCFIALGFIILLALNRQIPYQVWRWWHKLSGPLFIIVVLHWLSIDSPIRLSSSAGIWLGALCVLGTIAALYKLILYPLVSSGGLYKITAVEPGPQAVHLELKPVKKGFPFQAGQFGFLSIMEKGLREPHPFTIASATTQEGDIHFVIRALGDYTKKLQTQAKVGMLADVRAPHGRFQRDPNATKEIWIGAGVGITPFIAWLQDENAGHFDRVQLIYCYDPNRAFPSVDQLEQLTSRVQASLIPNPSGSHQLSETITQATLSTNPNDIHISFCGPKGLLTHVKKLMKAAGIPEKNIHYELFEFR